MATDLIREIEQEYLKDEIPELEPGDTVKVMVRIIEGKRERLQGFEGVVIRTAGSGTSATVTVRRVFQGVGVERVFLLHSPKVESIKVLRRGDVRRARLYYMRGRAGKAARIREKIGATVTTRKKEALPEKPVAETAPEEEKPVPQPAAEVPQEQEQVQEPVVETPVAETAEAPQAAEPTEQAPEESPEESKE